MVMDADNTLKYNYLTATQHLDLLNTSGVHSNETNLYNNLFDSISLGSANSNAFVQIPVHPVLTQNNILSREQGIHEIKSEPIKFELSDIHLSQIQQNLNQTNLRISGDKLPGNSNLIIARPKIPIKCYKCYLCPFMSISSSILDNHIKIWHSKSKCFGNDVNNSKKLCCPGCPNTFYMKTPLEAHLENDHQMARNEIGPLIESLLSDNDSDTTNKSRKSRIFLKNVDFLRGDYLSEKNNFDAVEPNLMFSDESETIIDNDVLLIDLENIKENQNVNSEYSQVNKMCIQNVDILDKTNGMMQCSVMDSKTSSRDSDNIFHDMNTEFTNNSQTDLENEAVFTNNENIKPNRAKIYIKNVDILKQPILVPNNLSNEFNVNDYLKINYLGSSSINSMLPLSNKDLNPSKNKIQIGNLETNQSQLHIPRKLTNSLHLRTVDELNLMNMNDVQNLITRGSTHASTPRFDSSQNGTTPRVDSCIDTNLDQNANNQEAVNQPFENSNNSDEMLPDLFYQSFQRGINNIDDELIHTNVCSDYNFSTIENFINSNSSSNLIEQKNADIEFDLNTPQCSIRENDDDIFFVCAEEIINANSGRETVVHHDLTETQFPLIEKDVEGVLEDLESSINSNQIFPEKARIYVSNKLMENKSDINNISNTKKTKGRPFGARQINFNTLKNKSNQTTTEIGFKCDLNCAIRFKKRINLEYHKKCHKSSGHEMQCPECGSDFRSINTLHTHLWRQHQIDMELYSCIHCNFKTPILSRLQNTHNKIHSDERKFKCEQCGKSFKNTKQLKNHRRLHRSESTKIQKCNFCGSVFSHTKTLRDHKRQEHGENEAFKCTVCSKPSSSKSALKLHLLTHEDSLKFKCDSCTYATNDHNAFRRHKMIHGDNKMYNCKFCNYKCIQSNLYKKHIIRKHPEHISDVILKCKMCPFTTINRSKFEVHSCHTNLNHLFIPSSENELVKTLSSTNRTTEIDYTQMEAQNIQITLNPDRNNFKNKIKVRSNAVLKYCNENVIVSKNFENAVT